MRNERAELRAQLDQANEAFHEANDRLESERASKADIVDTIQMLERQLKESKEAAIASDNATTDKLDDLTAIQLQELRDELVIETERARSTEAQTHELQQQVVVLEQKLKRAEAAHAEELKANCTKRTQELASLRRKLGRFGLSTKSKRRW